MIKKVALLAFAAGLLLSSGVMAQDLFPNKYVKPNLGAVHARWFFYTPAALPFGMAKLAPHTNAYGSPGSWLPCGYDDRHGSIEGFGHFHEFQVGGVVVMPTVGKLKTVPGTVENPELGYRSRFDKKEEHAEPGYYSVFLEDYGIKAEITATTRVGFHRYTFPKTDNAHLIFDIGHKQGESSDVVEAYMAQTGDKTVEGYVITYPEYVKFCQPGGRVKMYFYAEMNKSPKSVGSFVDDKQVVSAKETKGIANGMFLNFDMKEGEQLLMKVGVSYTSIANAKLNLQKEAATLAFDDAKQRAVAEWQKMLGRIEVKGKSEDDKVKFYTGLYHSLLGRGISSDVNGQYPKNDGGVGQIALDKNGVPTHNHHNTDGVWGAFWNLFQLWGLAYPDVYSDYMQSVLDFHKDTGWMHDGEAAGMHSNGVQTNFMGLALAAAYNCGIRDFDIKHAYQAARDNELEYRNRPFGSGKYDLHYFVNNGYVPYKDTTISNGWVFNFGASHTLEFAFSSYAVANMAKALGKKADYKRLINQATFYRNIFDSETRYIRPKLESGEFIKDYNPKEAWKGFQEGNGYQYTWYAPHDIGGLINLVGKDLFNERLDKTFFESQKLEFGGGKQVDSFAGIEMLYNQGNQPCLHIAWLYNYSGKPWLTQKWTRTICNEFYGVTPSNGYGYGQDEDQGQLGTWFVLASMGLFDVQGHSAASPSFQIGSPMFDEITIHLHPKYTKGKTLKIVTANNSKDSFYVQDASFNGKSLNSCWIPRNDLMKGGVLRLGMGATPNTSWGVATPPPSMTR
ncbi:GH92 family glycosyl hydrolase [Alistipes sp. ZOR0009]|uniref:GH92 family glycosyl hydrolase n=1 Tax=Alistipes sp. ZOR0009 TaxID=1339253 RepID=UPI000A796E1C|nr:GH92 family glycosyl hydrolase [Alistipes sp. ZOR0009]